MVENEEIVEYYDEDGNLIENWEYEEIIEETVVLKFDKDRFPYVVNKPIHQTQKVMDYADCTLSINVRPNKELESRIFSYGPQVEVLLPSWFREQISKKIEENYKKYFPVQINCTEAE